MKRLWCTGAGLLVLLSGCCSTGALTVADGELMVEEESYRGDAGMRFAAKAASPAPAMAARNMVAMDSASSESLGGGEMISAPEGRKMIFTAHYFMTVLDVKSAQDALQKQAESLGGYVQSITDDTMTLRIPLDKANGFLGDLGKFGTINSRSISGRDVTSEMVDMEIRLENLELMRRRLQALADQGGSKVEQLLEVERELGRVTTEIERYKGQLKLLTNQVDYVTVTLNMNAELPVGELVRRIPVDWVANLGQDLWNDVPVNGEYGYAFDVDLPLNFTVVSYFKDMDVTYAISSDEGVIKLSRKSDFKGATDEFWRGLLKRGFTEAGNFTLVEEYEFETGEGLTGYVISGKRQLNQVTYGYQVMLVRHSDELYLYEFWAPEEVFDGSIAKVKDSLKSVDLIWWR